MQLENFAYIASHDLKEPICSIQGLIDLLDMSANEKLDEDEKLYVSLLKTATTNMQNLVEDLLMYSRVNSQQFSFDIVNLKGLLDTIQFDLRARIQETQGTIEVKNIPNAINADPTKLRQLLQNLITNALKFQEAGVKPHVKISCEDQEREWIFAIEDNGIGIKPEFHEKIFLLFRRLHSRTEYEGTGIGLAICKKIVEQHGGRIWVESDYKKGTTFYFSVSKNLD
ncbi:MAG: ATP-binding protein, partial [Chitinophagales bacterium]